MISRSENMRRIRSRDMRPELAVRREVHGMGYRYRLHRSDLPGKPDLVFGSKRKVIFVNGCFWHQHPSRSCPIVRMPRSNLSYWAGKLRKNLERDRANVRNLSEMGWEVLIVWECELGDMGSLRARIKNFLEGLPSQHNGGSGSGV